MPTKSIKLHWNEKAINDWDVLGVPFGDRKDTIEAARNTSVVFGVMVFEYSSFDG